jgi:hypothetical protein
VQSKNHVAFASMKLSQQTPKVFAVDSFNAIEVHLLDPLLSHKMDQEILDDGWMRKELMVACIMLCHKTPTVMCP